MGDYSWTLHTNADSGVTAREHRGGQPTLRRGNRIRTRFGFSESNYLTMLDYLEFASAVAIVEGLDGEVYYLETHADTHELLVGFEPTGADHPSDVTGWWGVIVGGSDRTDASMGTHVIEFETVVLAAFSTYASRSAVKTAHER